MTSPGPFRAQLDRTVGGLRVTKENVLFVRDAIVNEADRLDVDLKQHWRDATTIPRYGGDPVSADASVAFSYRAEKLLTQAKQYVADLRAAGQALDATARHYGLTEEDIRNTMHSAASVTPDQPADAMRGSDLGQLITGLTTVPSPPAPSDVPLPLPTGAPIAVAGPPPAPAAATLDGAPGLMPGAVPVTPGSSGATGVPTIDEILNPGLYGR